MENMITPKDDSDNEKVVDKYPLKVSLKLNKNVYTNNENIIGFLKIVFTKEYSISGLPSLLVFVNGEPVERMVGLMPKSTIIGNIEKHL